MNNNQTNMATKCQYCGENYQTSAGRCFNLQCPSNHPAHKEFGIQQLQQQIAELIDENTNIHKLYSENTNHAIREENKRLKLRLAEAGILIEAAKENMKLALQKGVLEFDAHNVQDNTEVYNLSYFVKNLLGKIEQFLSQEAEAKP